MVMPGGPTCISMGMPFSFFFGVSTFLAPIFPATKKFMRDVGNEATSPGEAVENHRLPLVFPLEGKDDVVQAGDSIHFRLNVGTSCYPLIPAPHVLGTIV